MSRRLGGIEAFIRRPSQLSDTLLADHKHTHRASSRAAETVGARVVASEPAADVSLLQLDAYARIRQLAGGLARYRISITTAGARSVGAFRRFLVLAGGGKPPTAP